MKKKENKRAESKRVSRFPNRDKKSANRNSHHPANEFSTVFNIKKPCANGIYIPAIGCISESRAIRACLMIRVFNN